MGNGKTGFITAVKSQGSQRAKDFTLPLVWLPDHLPWAIMLHIMHSNGLKWQRFVYKMAPFLRKPNSLHTRTGLLIKHKIHSVTEVGPHIPALLSILRSDLPIYQLRSKAWGAQSNRT